MGTTQLADPKRKSIHYRCKLIVIPNLFPRTAGFFSYLITTLRLLASELHDGASYGVDPQALIPQSPSGKGQTAGAAPAGAFSCFPWKMRSALLLKRVIFAG